MRRSVRGRGKAEGTALLGPSPITKARGSGARLPQQRVLLREQVGQPFWGLAQMGAARSRLVSRFSRRAFGTFAGVKMQIPVVYPYIPGTSSCPCCWAGAACFCIMRSVFSMFSASV